MRLEYLELGKIVSTHGVRGELRVQAWCDSFEFFSSFKNVYVGKKDKTPYGVVSSRPHGNVVLLTLEGVDNLDKANELRNKTLYVKRAEAPLEEGRYFIAELLGCKVVDSDDESIVYGTVKDVTNTGASDVWHIESDKLNESGKREIYLLPSIPEVVISVDIDNEIAVIKPLKGIFGEAFEVRED